MLDAFTTVIEFFKSKGIDSEKISVHLVRLLADKAPGVGVFGTKVRFCGSEWIDLHAPDSFDRLWELFEECAPKECPNCLAMREIERGRARVMNTKSND